MEATTTPTEPAARWLAAIVAAAIITTIVVVAVMAGSPEAGADTEEAWLRMSWGVPTYGGW